MLYIVPIEPLEERYSAQWLDWTCRKMGELLGKGKLKTNWQFVLPSECLYDKIETGAFLDAVKTNVFKNKQMEMILQKFQAGEVKKDDVFWFHDLWFPGLEMLFYIRNALGLKFKICGCLHAGTYDPYDYLTRKGMNRWGRALELCWFNEVDSIFVATEFHKRLLLSKFDQLEKTNNVHVTGFPIWPDTFVPGGRIPEPNEFPEDMHNLRIVFPHRLDAEKNPHLFSDLQEIARKTYDFREYQFVRTKDVCKTKKDYYELLRSSHIAVSFSEQETWGIAMQEAVFCGCLPIVPDRLSYPEMYRVVLPQMPKKSFLYQCTERAWNSDAHAVMEKILNMITCYCVYKDLWHPLRYGLELAGRNAFDRMLALMGVVE